MKTYPLYLNGQSRPSSPTFKVVNPATGEPFAEISTVDRATVAASIRDAHAAFISWRETTARVRADFLLKIAAEVERRKDEIARLITLENGKPLVQAIAEVTMGIDHFRWFAEEAPRAYGRVIPNQVEGKRHLVLKSPVGVVAAISPWNFPFVLGVRKVAPALAAGCTVILKPARQTPLSSVALAECIHAAAVPAGVFQLVAGSASDIAAEFLENRVCRKISFTGSTEVGKKLIAGAAAQVKRLSLELGGHAPVLIFESANLEKAVEQVVLAKFRNTGQSCIAANRIFVQRPIYQKFLDKFEEKVRALKVGDGFEAGVEVGPMINQDGLDKAIGHVSQARAAGGRVICGGEKLARPGFFLAPCVIADVPDQALCMAEETFAPIAPVAAFDTEEEGLKRANQSDYGLSGYVFTEDLRQAFRVIEKLETGMIGLNDGLPTTSQSPFGGVKESGWGRELGSEGLDAFLETKHVALRL